MALEFEYLWAIMMLFVMERICCLQEQFDRDFAELDAEELHRSVATIMSMSDLEEFAYRDKNLKLSFFRLGHLMHILMMLALVYFCNISFWFIMVRPLPPKVLFYRFRLRPFVRRFTGY